MSVDTRSRWADVQRKLDIVRPHCRQLRSALTELDLSATQTNADRARAICRELRAVLRELSPATQMPFRCDQPSCSVLESPRTTCWLKTLQDISQAHSATEHGAAAIADAAAIVARPAAVAARATRPRARAASRRYVTPLLVRQAISFLALVLAYLNYYMIDVQLQILGLPAVFP